MEFATAIVPGRFKDNVFENGGYRVPVSVHNSPVAGNGVFLDADLAEGTLITGSSTSKVGLHFGRTLKECTTVVDELQLNASERSSERLYVKIHGYGYWGPNGEGPWWRLANDKADFTNHQSSDAGARLTVRCDPTPTRTCACTQPCPFG